MSECVSCLLHYCIVALSHDTVVWGILSLRYVRLFVCTVTLFSAADKDSGVKRCILVRDELLPLLVNFGSRGVTAAALLPG